MFNSETKSVCILLEDKLDGQQVEVTLEVEFDSGAVTSIIIEDPFEFIDTEYDSQDEFPLSLCESIVCESDDIPDYGSFDDLDDEDIAVAFNNYIQTIAEI